MEGGFEISRENLLLITQTGHGTTWQPGKGFLGDRIGIFGWGLVENNIPIEGSKFWPGPLNPYCRVNQQVFLIIVTRQ